MMETMGRKVISSGIERLDSILGGMFIGDNVIWYDESGSLAQVFWRRFIKDSLEKEKEVIFISFDRSPKNLFERLGVMGTNPNITVLDCFTNGKGKGISTFKKFMDNAPESVKNRITVVENPLDIDEFNNKLYSLHETLEGDVRLVFESLTGMQELWGGEDKVKSFYTQSCPRLYDLNTVAYWVMEKKAHSQRLRAQINQIAQVVISLSIKRGTSALEVIKAEGRETIGLQQPHRYHSKGLNIVFGEDKYADNHDQSLGKRIKALRIQKGLSQVEIAKQVGVSASTISQIESNTIYPSIPGLLKISEILNKDPGYFLSGNFLDQEKIVFHPHEASPVGLLNINAKDGASSLLMPLAPSGRASAYIVEIKPGAVISGPFFDQEGHNLAGLVTEGELRLDVNGQVEFAGSGDMIYLNEEKNLKWINSGNTTVSLILLKLV